MNTNLEALVEAASGAHPIPEQEAAAALAAAVAVETVPKVEALCESQQSGIVMGSAVSGQDDDNMTSSQVATEEVIAASVALEQSAKEEEDSIMDHPTSTMAHSVVKMDEMAEESNHNMMGDDMGSGSATGSGCGSGMDEDHAAAMAASVAAVGGNVEDYMVAAANAAATVVTGTEADAAAAAAAVAAVEATRHSHHDDDDDDGGENTTMLLDVNHMNGDMDASVPTPISSAPTPTTTMTMILSQEDEANELAKNMPGSRIAERRRKGWVKKTWDERLEELKAYKEVHGHANVPTISKENPSLGHWVHDQRKQYRLYQEKKQTAMTSERIKLLENVGFKWALQRHTAMKSWNERFEELKKYKAEKGDCNVPIRYRDNPSLGQWVSTQRQEYGAKVKGRRSNTTLERIKALEDIGFQWFLRDTSKMAPRKSWEAHFQSLVSFKEKHGHCDVRVRSKQHPTGSLGRWVEKQRHHYNTRREGLESKITDEQIQKLEDLGFKWRVRNEKKAVAERREKLRAEAEAQLNDDDDDDGDEVDAAAMAAEVIANVEANAGDMSLDPTIMAVNMAPVTDANMSIDIGAHDDLHAEINRAALAAVEATTLHNTSGTVTMEVPAAFIGDSMDVHGVQVPVVPAPGDVSEHKIEQDFHADSSTGLESSQDVAI